MCRVSSFLALTAVVLLACSTVEARRPRERITLVEDGNDIHTILAPKPSSEVPAELAGLYAPLPFFVVTEYGAVGDNQTDCVPSVEKAVNAMVGQGGGGVLFFPAGVYRFSSRPSAIAAIEIWTATQNVQWVVAGSGSQNTTLVFDSAVGAPLLYFSTPANTIPLHFALLHLTIEPLLGPSQYAYDLIQIEDTVNSTIQDVNFVGLTNQTFSSLISISSSQNVAVINVNFSLQATEGPAAVSVQASDNIAFSEVNFQQGATMGVGVNVTSSTQIIFENVFVNSTLRGSAISLIDVQNVALNSLILASPLNNAAWSGSFQNGILVDQACDQIFLEGCLFEALPMGLTITSNQSLTPAWASPKRVNVTNSRFVACGAAITVSDNTTLWVTESSFIGADISLAGGGIISQSDPMSVFNTGVEVTVTNSLFTQLGSFAVATDTGYWQVQNCTFDTVNIGVSYSAHSLPTDPTEEPALSVVANSFHDVEQYVLFIEMIDLAQVTGNNCTLSDRRLGTLDSHVTCVGTHAPQGCSTTGNVGCTFNVQP